MTDMITELTRVCTLDGEERAARLEALRQFVSSAAAVVPVSGGVLLRFERSTRNAQAIRQIVEAERVCCALFEYRVRDEADAPTIELEITGAGLDSIVRALYGSTANS